MIEVMTDIIEYGDERAPETYWSKVHVVPEMSCWVWTGAVKKEKSREQPLAVYNAKHKRCSTLLVYMAVTFLDMDREKQKTLRTCGKSDCANPNHVKVMLKGECIVDPEHGVNRYPNGQCIGCRKVKDKAIPKEVINERARQYRKTVTKGGGVITRKKPVTTAKTRPIPNGPKLSVFGDVKPDKPWRPAGWSERPEVNPCPQSHQNNE